MDKNKRGKTKICLSIDEEVVRRLRIRCAELGLAYSQYVEMAVVEKLEKVA